MACIRTKTHYVDISKEQQSLQLLFQRLLPEIQNAGIVCVPGLGFDSVATECLAALLQHHLPTATHLKLSFAFANFSGSAFQFHEGYGKPMFGKIFSAADMNFGYLMGAFRKCHCFTSPVMSMFPNPGKTLVATAGGANCYMASRLTHIENIDTYIPIDVNVMRLILFVWRVFAFLLRWIPLMHWFILHVMDVSITTGPSEEQRKGKPSIDVWGEVRDSTNGEYLRGSLQVMEAYGFAQQASIQGVLRIMDASHSIPSGVWTPSQAFGPEFVLSIPGTVAYSFVRFEQPPQQQGSMARIFYHVGHRHRF